MKWSVAVFFHWEITGHTWSYNTFWYLAAFTVSLKRQGPTLWPLWYHTRLLPLDNCEPFSYNYLDFQMPSNDSCVDSWTCQHETLSYHSKKCYQATVDTHNSIPEMILWIPSCHSNQETTVACNGLSKVLNTVLSSGWS
jgi:hypothetical protein